MNFLILAISLFILTISGCYSDKKPEKILLTANCLDYSADPESAYDRKYLAFSDKGAWFAYGFPTSSQNYGGFAGPFLMTQENGVWSSPVISKLRLIENISERVIDLSSSHVVHNSYLSHLEQSFSTDELLIEQKLFYYSSQTAITTCKITNQSDRMINLSPEWHGSSFVENLLFSENQNSVVLKSDKSYATGQIQVYNSTIVDMMINDSTYSIKLDKFNVDPGKSETLYLSHSFAFPEYSIKDEIKFLQSHGSDFELFLNNNIHEKNNLLIHLYEQLNPAFNQLEFHGLIEKSLQTLQNNWRTAAGELKHSGLFPSYFIKWFHGFWAWDSWKHAAAIAHFNPELAKEQIKAMYHFMDDEGFIADCIFRDTGIENHNFRIELEIHCNVDTQLFMEFFILTLTTDNGQLTN